MPRMSLHFTYGQAHFLPRPRHEKLRGAYFSQLANWLVGLGSGIYAWTRIRLLREAMQGSATIDLTSVTAGTVLTINGVPFTAVSGTPVVANGEFQVGVSDAADAISLATAINGSTDARILNVLTATASMDAVVVTAVDGGALTNSITVATNGVVATGTVTAAGVLSGDNFTINGVTLTSRQEMARQIVTLASCVGGELLTINGVQLLAILTASTVSGFQVGVNDTADAAALAAVINAHPVLSTQMTASSALGVVKLRAIASGTTANAYTLTKVGATITLGGATFAGGQATSATTWDYGDTNSQAAQEMVRCVNAATNPLISLRVRALQNAAVCTLYARDLGEIGNANTLASSNAGRLLTSGARLTGGVVTEGEGTRATATITIVAPDANPYVATINGVDSVLDPGVAGDANATATGLCAAIQANEDPLVQPLVFATVAANVITIHAQDGGASGNIITLAASGTGATASGGRLTGGTAATTFNLAGPTLAGGTDGTLTTFVNN